MVDVPVMLIAQLGILQPVYAHASTRGNQAARGLFSAPLPDFVHKNKVDAAILHRQRPSTAFCSSHAPIRLQATASGGIGGGGRIMGRKMDRRCSS